MFLKAPRVDPALLAVVAEGFFSRLSFGIISFALPLYAYHIGMSLSAIGVLISLNVIAEMALKPLVAPLVDRFGAKLSLSAAVVFRSLVAFALALASAPSHLFGIRVLHGASESLRDPSVNTIISEYGGKSTIASSFAWYNTAKVVAGALGKAAAGVLLTMTLSNYPLVFIIAFFLSAFPIITVVRYVKGGDRKACGTPDEECETSQAEETESGSRPSVMRAFGLGVLISGTGAMLNNLFPLLATKYAGLTEAEAGIVYAATTLVIIFAGPLFGWLSDNVSRKLVLLSRGIANTISSLLYIAFPNLAGVAAAKIVDDMGKAAFRPAWGALMAEISSFDKSRRARTLGYMGLAENIGETAGPLLAGFLWYSGGVVVMLTARAALAVMTEVYAVFAGRPLERKRGGDPGTAGDKGAGASGVLDGKQGLGPNRGERS